MKQLLIRADDLGYSYAVNIGIVRSVREGLVRSVGLMPNMPEAARGYQWLQAAAREIPDGVAIGQHTNVCLGVPCSDPKLIPSLVQEDGTFKSSKMFRASRADGIDFVDVDEAVLEIEAQLARFREIAGRDPDYFEAHAVASDNLFAAIGLVARKHGLKEQPLLLNPSSAARCGDTLVRMVLRSSIPDYDPEASIRGTVETMRDGETVVMVCHPGYLDRFILDHSSLTDNRTKEVDALIDPELRSWLEAQPDLRMVDYREL